MKYKYKKRSGKRYGMKRKYAKKMSKTSKYYKVARGGIRL